MKAGELEVRVFDNFPRAEKLTSSEPLPPVFLVFDGRIVKPALSEPGWQEMYRDFYRNEAERFLRALNAVAPGGFMDALFGVMALEQASLFVKVPSANPLAPAPREEMASALRETYQALASVSSDIHDAAETDAAWERVDKALGLLAAAVASGDGAGGETR